MLHLKETYICMPSVERGHGILISGHPKSNSILYTNNRSVVIFNLDNPLDVFVYGDHSYPVTVARYSPNGEWIASGDVSGTVRIWGAYDDHVLKNEFRVLSGRIDDLQWSADGLRIVACGDGKGKSLVRAFMWDAGTSIGEFDGHSRRVLSCSYKPKRPFRIVTCGEDFVVNFYEGPPFKFKLSHREHSNFVNCVRFSPDGSKFISVGSDKKGVIYDANTGAKIGELPSEGGHRGSIYVVSWSPDSEKVLTVSADKSAKVWDVSNSNKAQLVMTWTSSTYGGVGDMLVGGLWQNNYIVTISFGGILNIFSASDLDKPLFQISGHTKNVTSLTVLDTVPKTIISGGYDGLMVKWNQGTGYCGLLQMKENVQVKCITATKNEVVISAFHDKIWRSSLLGDRCEEGDAINIGTLPKDLSLATSCPELVLVAISSGLVLIRGSKVVSTVPLGFQVTASAISPDGHEAIVGADDGKVRVYAISDEQFKEKAVLEKHRGSVTVIRYSPDAAMFASGDANREALVWDRASHQVKLNNMVYHTARINCLAWSPDSSMVATGSLDMSVIVYTIGKPASSRWTVRGAHCGGVYGLAFADKYLLSCGEDACIRVWQLKEQA